MQSIRGPVHQGPYVHKSIGVYLHAKIKMIRVHFSYEDVQYFDRLVEMARGEGQNKSKLLRSILMEVLNVSLVELGAALKAKAGHFRSVGGYARNILIDYLEKGKDKTDSESLTKTN